MANEVTVRTGSEQDNTEISNGEQRITATKLADPTVGEGPAPSDLLLAALGSCKAKTMRMYADRKGWALAEASVRLLMEVVKSEQQQTTYIRCHIELAGDLDEAQRQRLLDIANKCPVHKLLAGNIEINANLLP